MRLIGMRLALLVTLLLASASDIPAPTLSSSSNVGAVREASAAVQRPMWSAGAITGDVKLTAVSRVRATAAVEGAKGIGRAGLAAHPTAYAIPADHPRPPLGRFKLTAYSGPQLGQAQAITATGKAARPGRTVAVDPKVIPLGARVYIEGVGERIAEDVGGGIRGQHIDIYVPTLPQAKTFGVKRRVVSVVALPEDDG